MYLKHRPSNDLVEILDLQTLFDPFVNVKLGTAYLSQLENGKIKKPSPNVLHCLAATYAVPYEALMEKASWS